MGYSKKNENDILLSQQHCLTKEGTKIRRSRISGEVDANKTPLR